MSQQPSDPAAQKPPKPRPAPVPEAESAAYWSAAHDGRLLVQRCDRCERYQLYPRDHCISCGGPVSWEEASGKGSVYSFTVIRQNYARPFRDQIPYVVALVDLQEGPRLMTNIVDCAVDDVHIDMPVEATFEPVSDDAGIALFRPARS